MDNLKLTLGMAICSYYLSPEPEFGKRLAQAGQPPAAMP